MTLVRFDQWMCSSSSKLFKSKHLSNQFVDKNDCWDLFPKNITVFPVADLFLSDLHKNLTFYF